MNDVEIERLASSLGVTNSGMELIRDIRTSRPARRVKAHGATGNKAIRFPSLKMGHIIQAESKTIEYPNVLINEFDPDVIEFWDQPPNKLAISYQGATRKITSKPTLDFFVISKKFIGYEECKPTTVMNQLVEDYPDRFSLNADTGVYGSPAMTRALHGTGLEFRIITEKSFRPILIDNIEFIMGYYTTEPNAKTKSHIESVINIVKKHSVISLVDLINIADSSEAVYYAIAKQQVFVDLSENDITDLKRFIVYENSSIYEKNRIIYQDLSIQIDTDEISSKLMSSSPDTLVSVIKKVDQLEKLADNKITRKALANIFGVTTKTVSRWANKIAPINDRQQKIIALLPNYLEKGNRGSRVDWRVDRIIYEEIENKYLSQQAFVAHQVFLTICNRCDDEKLSSPSKKTFYGKLNNLSDSKVALERKGSKAAYQHEAYQYHTEADIPFKGSTRYLQYVHCDHTQIDVQTVDEFDQPIGKPWLTTLVDDYTGAILSYYLSYDHPSYIAVMMVIRLMVKHREVLPEGVVIDGGKEFKSTNFEVFTAQFKITLLSREGQPRSGNAGERFFGTVNSTIIHNLSGNTKHMKDPRNIARTHNPIHSALWDISSLVVALGGMFKEYNEKSAISGGRSANQLIKLSQDRFGERTYLHQVYDSDFMFATLPIIKRRTASLTRGKAIRVERHDYWHTAFRHLHVKKTKVEVKWDPMDASYVLAKLDGIWLKCVISHRNIRFRNEPRHEKSEVLRKNAEIHTAASTIARKDLNRVLMDLTEHEKVLEQNRKSKKKTTIEPVQEETDLTANYWQLDIPDAIEK